MRDKHAEFEIWLEDHLEKNESDSTIVLFNASYDIEWGENKTMVVKEFKEVYPHDYYYYFATYYVPLDQTLKDDRLDFDLEFDIEDDDFPQFKEDFFI
jgi:hypothetical protein